MQTDHADDWLPLAGKVALVTGASRGIGAATARLLAARGADIVINCRDKHRRAESVAQQVRALGRATLVVQADLTEPAATAGMFDTVRQAFGQLDLLVLSAAGGLERDMPSDYALRLNRDAQVRAVDLAVPLMVAGGRVVFVTSHYAHRYGTEPFPPFYQPVAASKHAGEEALRALIPDLKEHNLSLVVVSGDLVEGTIAVTLVERSSPGFIESRRRRAGALPTMEQFATAVADAATDVSLESGATVFVGNTT